jgi:hypothetical protein
VKWILRILFFLAFRLAIMFWPVTLLALGYVWFVYF